MHQEKIKSYQGFTLIELAVVLVIIGLVIGSIVVGRELVAQAEIRSAVSQMESYRLAVNSFKIKYGALPGDITATRATQLQLAARGSYKGQGDGNNVLEGISSNAQNQNSGLIVASGETGLFWRDLYTVGMIGDRLTTATAIDVPTISDQDIAGVARYLPQSELQDGNFVYVWSQDTRNGMGIAKVSGIDTGRAMTGPGATVMEAYNIDVKVDDGLPLTGKIVAKYITSSSTMVFAANGPMPSDSQEVMETPMLEEVALPDMRELFGIRDAHAFTTTSGWETTEYYTTTSGWGTTEYATTDTSVYETTNWETTSWGTTEYATTDTSVYETTILETTDTSAWETTTASADTEATTTAFSYAGSHDPSSGVLDTDTTACFATGGQSALDSLGQVIQGIARYATWNNARQNCTIMRIGFN